MQPRVLAALASVAHDDERTLRRCDRLILELDPFTIKLGALVSTGGETFGNMSPKKKTKKIAKKNAEKSRVTSWENSNISYYMTLLILIRFC